VTDFVEMFRHWNARLIARAARPCRGSAPAVAVTCHMPNEYLMGAERMPVRTAVGWLRDPRAGGGLDELTNCHVQQYASA
jgi:hypothetical protein